MSWMAHEWAESAPVADVQEFAILSVMAQYANMDGTGVFKSPGTIAEIIRCDEKTVKRRIQAMVSRGLLGLGDQRMAAYIEKRYRPKVYDLLIPHSWYSAAQLEKVNRDRASRGLGPLIPEYRPPIEDAGPGRKRRSDCGVPRPRRSDEDDASDTSGGTSSPAEGGLVVQSRGDYKTPNTVLKNQSSDTGDQDQKIERSADAPSPQASTVINDPWLLPSHDTDTDPLPPPNYLTEPKEWIEIRVLGFDAGEEPMVDSMLERGEEPKKILNKILKDREGIAGGERSAVKGNWLPYVRRKVGGWREGERDYARKLLADYHPDVVVGELWGQRQSAA